jgi:hypothetical protein
MFNWYKREHHRRGEEGGSYVGFVSHSRRRSASFDGDACLLASSSPVVYYLTNHVQVRFEGSCQRINLHSNLALLRLTCPLTSNLRLTVTSNYRKLVLPARTCSQLL